MRFYEKIYEVDHFLYLWVRVRSFDHRPVLTTSGLGTEAFTAISLRVSAVQRSTAAMISSLRHSQVQQLEGNHPANYRCSLKNIEAERIGACVLAHGRRLL